MHVNFFLVLSLIKTVMLANNVSSNRAGALESITLSSHTTLEFHGPNLLGAVNFPGPNVGTVEFHDSKASTVELLMY